MLYKLYIGETSLNNCKTEGLFAYCKFIYICNAFNIFLFLPYIIWKYTIGNTTTTTTNNNNNNNNNNNLEAYDECVFYYHRVMLMIRGLEL